MRLWATATLLALLGACTPAADAPGPRAAQARSRIVGDDPVIDSFTVSPSSGAEPLTVSFTVTAHPGDVLLEPIVGYDWDFDGDGTFDESTPDGTTTHVYADNAPSGSAWTARVRVSDITSSSTSTVTVAVANVAPTVEVVADQAATEATPFSMGISATDPSPADKLTYSRVSGAPTGFVLNANTGDISWTPTFNECAASPGRLYTVTVRVTDDDGGSTDVSFALRASWKDTDGDGIPDSWEISHGLDSSNATDGLMDRDGDGILNLDEFHNANGGPHTPNPVTLTAPGAGAVVVTAGVTLTVKNTTDPDTASSGLSYHFQVFPDAALTQPVLDTAVPGASGTTTFLLASPPSTALVDDHRYHWRVQALDGVTHGGAWSSVRTFVYDPPSAPQLQSPLNGAGVNTPTPTLTVDNASDVDSTTLTYYFALYEGPDAGSPLLTQSPATVAGDGGSTGWTVNKSLVDNQGYRWRARVKDEQGSETSSPEGTFRVHFANVPPTDPALRAPDDNALLTDVRVPLTVANSTDPDGDTLTYRFEWDTDPSFNSSNHGVSPFVASGPASTTFLTPELQEDHQYVWRVRASDGSAFSGFQVRHFFISRRNDPPTVPIALSPLDGLVHAEEPPTFIVRSDPDPEGDDVRYDFEVHRSTGGALVAHGDDVPQAPTQTSFQPARRLPLNQSFLWRARAKDDHGGISAWSEPVEFKYRTADGCGCSSDGGGFGLFALGLLAFALHPRMQHRRGPS